MAAASYWRVKGISYLHYLTVGANVVRNSLKEPLKTEALKRSKVHYAMSAWTDGKQGPTGECKGERRCFLLSPAVIFAHTIFGKLHPFVC